MMNIILKTQKGYLNVDTGIKIVKEKADATPIKISDMSKQKERIYKEKPMIGIITPEVII